jgi:hypothetical protein
LHFLLCKKRLPTGSTLLGAEKVEGEGEGEVCPEKAQQLVLTVTKIDALQEGRNVGWDDEGL